jgi:hypothetical protein
MVKSGYLKRGGEKTMTGDELIEITQALHDTWTGDKRRTITFTSRDAFVRANIVAIEAAAKAAGVSARVAQGKFQIINSP